MKLSYISDALKKIHRIIKRSTNISIWWLISLFRRTPTEKLKCLILQGRYEKALAMATRLLSISPDDKTILILAGAAGWAANDSRLWFEVYNKVFSRHDNNLLYGIFNDLNSGFHPLSPRLTRYFEISRYRKARELIESGDYRAALDKLGSLRNCSKKQWQVIAARARCYYELKDPLFPQSLLALGAANFHAPELGALLREASDDGETICILFAPEKTGNQSIRHSLVNSGHFLVLLVLQHTLNDNLGKAGKHARNNHAWGAMFNNLRTEIAYRAFLFDYHLPKKRALKIITLVREPVSMEVSRYFFLNEIIYREKVDASPDQFFQFLWAELDSGESPLGWLDREIKSPFGIDVFRHQFNKSRGYQIYNKDNVQLLIMKLEKLDETFQIAMEEYLGIGNIQLIKTNAGENYGYFSKYRNLKRSIRFQQSKLEAVYKAARMEYFYTDDEIAGFRQAWLNPR